MALFDTFKKKGEAADAPKKEVTKTAKAPKATKTSTKKDLPAKVEKAESVETQTFTKKGGIAMQRNRLQTIHFR